MQALEQEAIATADMISKLLLSLKSGGGDPATSASSTSVSAAQQLQASQGAADEGNVGRGGQEMWMRTHTPPNRGGGFASAISTCRLSTPTRSTLLTTRSRYCEDMLQCRSQVEAAGTGRNSGRRLYTHHYSYTRHF